MGSKLHQSSSVLVVVLFTVRLLATTLWKRHVQSLILQLVRQGFDRLVAFCSIITSVRTERPTLLLPLPVVALVSVCMCRKLVLFFWWMDIVSFKYLFAPQRCYYLTPTIINIYRRGIVGYSIRSWYTVAVGIGKLKSTYLK